MELDWGQLIVFAGTAGLLSAALTKIFEVVGGWWTARRRATHLALRLAVQFETYGGLCGSAISSLETYLAGDEEGVICYAPAFVEMPGASEAWEHLNASLAHRVLAFPYLVSNHNSSAREYYDATGDEDTRGTMLGTLDLGLRAFLLGKDLRCAYRLPQFTEVEGTVEWMDRLAEGLRVKIKEIDDRRMARQTKAPATWEANKAEGTSVPGP